ncbi:MAG TPA: glycoside hydrolase family 2 TIM barrel-domain containing protein [Fimbriimonadaceae bacterium]|nr:glycoside hydrolase family 2 TIM barrel-domain containing protein [Fimbriimonadaceae bacterium]
MIASGNVSQLAVLGGAILGATGVFAVLHDAAPDGPSTVKLTGTPGQFELTRNGRPYFIRGVGGNGSRTLLVEIGGNSVRTWGAEQLDEALSEAQRHGLTVTAGIWLGHNGDFNYSDPTAVKKQFEMCKSVILKYKDHPALLMWAFGNEMEGNGKDPKVWEAIEAIAAMSKSIDPNHPTMTVIAEIGEDKVKSIQKYCPSIDIIGINSYGGAPTLAERYAKQGGRKPYVVTEFGPLGQWEVPKTRWDAPIEASSTEKADFYRRSYKSAVAQAKGTCLGSYAFLWGNKQEATATWFGMLLPDGTPLAAVETVSELWTGKPRVNLAPRIEELSVPQSDKLSQGQVLEATLVAADPEKRPLKVRWILTGEAVERLTAGRDERVPPIYPEAILESNDRMAKVKLPSKSGGYRLFAYVHDDAGLAAVANVPLFVEGP